MLGVSFSRQRTSESLQYLWADSCLSSWHLQCIGSFTFRFSTSWWCFGTFQTWNSLQTMSMWSFHALWQGFRDYSRAAWMPSHWTESMVGSFISFSHWCPWWHYKSDTAFGYSTIGSFLWPQCGGLSLGVWTFWGDIPFHCFWLSGISTCKMTRDVLASSPLEFLAPSSRFASLWR